MAPPDGHFVSGFLSDDVPGGFDTVWGFLARHEPATLTIMEDPVRGLLPDQELGLTLAGQEAAAVCYVPAPPRLREIGVERVIAFPDAVLRDLFP